MSAPRRLSAFFHLIEQDIEAAETLAQKKNHYAGYHCQQAVEKLMKALLLHQGIESGIEHQLYVVIEKFPKDSGWRQELTPLLKYSGYATTFRYPTPGGRVPPPPAEEEVLADLTVLRRLLAKAKAEAGMR